MRHYRLIFAAFLVIPRLAFAGVVEDRETLDSILGSTAFTETFESFIVADGGARAFTGIDLLDYQTVVDSQGPALVAQGVVFTGTRLQWDGFNYFGAPSKEILFESNSITIDFSVPQSAFGLDLRNFAGFTMTATATIFGADDDTILTSVTGMTLIGTPLFFGYEDVAGIGKVSFAASDSSWSPIIDNLAFVAIPEPSVATLLGAGLAAVVLSGRRKRVGRGNAA